MVAAPQTPVNRCHARACGIFWAPFQPEAEPLKSLLPFLLVVLLLPSWWGDSVALAADAIVTEVPMTSRDDEAEQAAMEAALVQALESLTRNDQIGQTPVVEKLKKSLRDYLLEYEISENAESEEEGDAGWLLHARFDRAALEQALQQAKGGKAPLVRDEVLFWLVYGYGDKPGKVLGRLGSEKLVGRVEKAAAAVGINAILPLYDLEDRKQVSAGDIEMGYVDGIEKATGRYHVGQYLTGTMRYRDKLWHVQLEQYGVVTIGESKNAVRALTMALNQLRQDTREISAQAATDAAIRIAVARVKSWRDYQRLSRYLEKMPGVRGVKPAGNAGDMALFDIELAESENAWLGTLRDDGMLAEAPALPADDGIAHHFYLVENGPERR